jgi:sigma-54 dependent transcriptional regulator, acetoin dehydrogenase operon transcriptional activator AcoR
MRADGMDAPHYYEVILDSIADGVLTVNNDMVVTAFNRSAQQITRVPREEAIGRKCFDVMRGEMCESACCIKTTMETGQPCQNRPVYIVRADNKRIPVSVTTSVLRDEQGTPMGAVEIIRDLSEINDLRQACRKIYRFEDIVSKNHRMMKLFGLLPLVASSRSTVLIEGASGTGKELVAKAIHNQGNEPDAPFVAVNCGALPDTLIEAELFGYRAGAFTDARRDKTGLFAAGGEGTIFLDEIGDISLSTQVSLLRVLQNKTYRPLGANTDCEMKARIITASHHNLRDLVEAKRFREDLYYRINVIRLTLPDLSERKEDISLLVDHFVERFNSLTGKHIAGVSDEVLAAFALHDWPGNIRELENAIEHAFILCNDGIIDLTHLPETIASRPTNTSARAAATLREIEKRAIAEALRRNGGRRMATARELDIHKNTLRRKIEAYGIDG